MWQVFLVVIAGPVAIVLVLALIDLLLGSPGEIEEVKDERDA